MPMLYLLLAGTITALHANGFHADASRLAFHAVAYYLTFIFLASLTLERWQIGLAAAVAMSLETLLASLGGVEVALLVVSLLLTAMMAFVCAYTSQRVLRLLQAVAGEQLRRERMGRYFSPQVATLLDERQDGVPSGESREVTILFSDIRDFTALSETLPGEQVVALAADEAERRSHSRLRRDARPYGIGDRVPDGRRARRPREVAADRVLRPGRAGG